MSIDFGYNVQEEGEDPLVTLAQEVLRIFSTVVTPKPFLVDLFPICDYPSFGSPIHADFYGFTVQFGSFLSGSQARSSIGLPKTPGIASERSVRSRLTT